MRPIRLGRSVARRARHAAWHAADAVLPPLPSLSLYKKGSPLDLPFVVEKVERGASRRRREPSFDSFRERIRRHRFGRPCIEPSVAIESGLCGPFSFFRNSFVLNASLSQNLE